MALGVATVWEVRTTGSSSNGGGFNVGNTNFPTDLVASLGTSASPLVSSASYVFVAGDVGALVFVKLGTNWIPGFYRIASVSAGVATLDAAIGAVVLYGGATVLNTVAGCATTAGPTGGTWGVDYSQQDSPRFTFTDLVIDATTNTKFTSAAFPVGKNFVGNILNVTSGTGFTVQRVEIVSTVTTVATCDKSLGTLSSTGGNGKLGGALDGLATAAAAAVGGNKVFWTGSFTTTATITFAQVVALPSPTAMPTRIIGYGTYRGDEVRAILTLATNTGLTGINSASAGFSVENAAVNCASLGTSSGITLSGAYSTIRNCLAQNFTAQGLKIVGTQSVVQSCEVKAGTSAASYGIHLNVAGAQVMDCCVHDNACPGIVAAQGNNTILRNLVTNNTGAASDGIAASNDCTVIHNTVHGSGRHGIHQTTAFNINHYWRDNLLTSNGGYGIVGASSAGTTADPRIDGNAYWNNTSGTRNFANDVGAVNPINGVAPYVNSLDVILSADPYVAKASDDYRLNTTAGGGAACRGFGVPRSWPGNTLTTSAPDMGAAQHTDSGGGVSGGLLINPGLVGGLR